MNRTRLIIADDHAILVDGLISILGGKFDVVATAFSGRELIEVAHVHKPDVILTETCMPDINGIDAARVIRKECDSVRIIFMTMARELRLLEEAFRAGASGYLLKSSNRDEFAAAIECVAQGGRYVTPLLGGDAIASILALAMSSSTSGGLSLRQRQILQLLAEGRTMKEIAVELAISTRTVESHKYEIMRCLGLRTTAHLVRYAVQSGLVRA